MRTPEGASGPSPSPGLPGPRTDQQPRGELSGACRSGAHSQGLEREARRRDRPRSHDELVSCGLYVREPRLLLDDREVIEEWVIDGLEPGESTSFETWIAVPPAGLHDVSLTVDPDNITAENNDFNNSAHNGLWTKTGTGGGPAARFARAASLS